MVMFRLSRFSAPGKNLLADSVILQTPPFPLVELEVTDPYNLLECLFTVDTDILDTGGTDT